MTSTDRLSMLDEITSLKQLLYRVYRHSTTTSLPMAIQRYGSEKKAQEEGRAVWREVESKLGIEDGSFHRRNNN